MNHDYYISLSETNINCEGLDIKKKIKFYIKQNIMEIFHLKKPILKLLILFKSLKYQNIILNK